MGRPTLVGPVGSSQLAKLANQMLVACTIAAVAEALLFAEHGGADPAQVREALLGGFADSTVPRQHGLRMVLQQFKPGRPAKYQVKNTSTALSLAKTLGLELPVLRVVDKLFADMVLHGDGELDHIGIIREIRRAQGLPVTDCAREQRRRIPLEYAEVRAASKKWAANTPVSNHMPTTA